MSGWFKNVARRLYYDLLLGPLGRAKPIPASTWDEQYQRGDWATLDSTEEIPHHMLVVGYALVLRSPGGQLPSILDVGCGNGRLLQLLAPYGVSRYLGIDLSTEAIRQARSLGFANASLEVANFEEWKASEKFAVIVFDETLYFAGRPVDVLARFAEWLEEGGFLIVSQWRHGHHGIVWKLLQTRFDVLHAASVENSNGHAWDVRVLRLRTDSNGRNVGPNPGRPPR